MEIRPIFFRLILFTIVFSISVTACQHNSIQNNTVPSTAAKLTDWPTATPDALRPTEVRTETPTPDPSPAAIAQSPEPDKYSELKDLVNKKGEWNVLILGPDGKPLYSHDAAEVIHPASTIKIAIAMLVMEVLVRKDPGLDRILNSGPQTVGRSYAQLLRAMVVLSEEDAAEALQGDIIAKLGWKEIFRLLRLWGAENTQLTPRRSSAGDLCRLLIDLYSNELPTRNASRYILELMAEETSADNSRIGKLRTMLPPGSIIYNKRGTLLEPLVVADTGIIVIPGKGPYFLSILGTTMGGDTYEELDAMIAEISLSWFRNQFLP